MKLPRDDASGGRLAPEDFASALTHGLGAMAALVEGSLADAGVAVLPAGEPPGLVRGLGGDVAYETLARPVA